jgi:SPP1 family predicted phage head-tail adaptor
MRAGQLNMRVAILRRSGTPNAFNEPGETWATYTTVWAAVTPISDGERMRAGETLAQKASRFVIRYSKTTGTVTPLDRIKFDGATYDINGVKEIAPNEYLELTATARAEAST